MTIKENLLLAKSDATDNEIIKEHGTKPYQFELSLDKYKDLSKLLKTHIFASISLLSFAIIFFSSLEI